MSYLKCTMLIDYTSNVSNASQGARTGGFSESYYHTNDGKAQIDFASLMQSRARMLPNGSRIVGQRYQVVDPVGGSTTGQQVYPGRANLAPDVPQMALYVRCGGIAVNNFRPLYFRALPDVRSQEGEYQPSIAFAGALSSVAQDLQRFRFKAVNLDSPQAPVLTISNAGLVRTTEDIALTEGQKAQVIRTEDTSGNMIGGIFEIGPVTNLREFSLVNWNGGTCAGGRIRQYNVIWPFFDPDKFGDPRVVVKKVGGPFNHYVGKASRRK